ncbi:UvrD-helicase domain-containing protein [Rhodococcus antarcticus]|uniref:RecBCD enzyme subunit RecB n=1 Tax=Rhodococcus antarcticus TaxID=2987751 RepID=A0ABY6P3I9_9NOCA|nr:UvrD-helicase domain-containing protein [Rhodococcus antarcticus]UZJ26220.1 UvrD-helicase domain-containing protein [Rhodococcus antarcticus]
MSTVTTPTAAAGPPPFDVCGPLPTGTTVLEASAGTGKTFTIAALTTRFVADGVCELAQVMLVTFGNAASRELRDRVRERMVSAERGLRDPDVARTQTTDPVLALLATGTPSEVGVRRERLVRALATFDAATIATTHSFCQQVLTGLGTAADTDHTATFTDTIDDLRQDVVDDLYVRAFAPSSDPPFITPRDLGLLAAAATGSDRQARLEPTDESGVTGRLRGAAQAIRTEVAARKRARGLVDHDDWLTQLRDALTDPVTGPVACQRVRDRYRVVMVDEFQDTDPVQWDVLRHAFHEHTTLVLIGDPKQSIYGFRGGDVTTYLAATGVATAESTLDRSWRSDARLVTALQHLLGGVALGDRRIVVRPVDSAHPEPRLTGAGAPLRVRRVLRAGPDPRKALAVGVARPLVATDVADDIVHLLTGPARLHGRPVGPGDIAVLVRTNKQVQLVRQALGTAGVPAVAAGGGTVFATAAARSWLVLLEAVEQPHRSGRVRAAALSVFLGRDEQTLDQLGDQLTDSLSTQLRGWSELLARRGVAAFLEVLTEQESLPARILARPDGERVLTDLRHAGQVLHAAALAESMGLTALVEWLRRRIARAGQENTDDRSRRLESDDDAVQVMTVHTSKGLEFPVVHVPFGWDRWNNDRPATLRLHDDAGHRVLHVGGTRSPSYDDARRRHHDEERGEDLRLLYVALTRASSQVVAHWAPTTNTATSSLHRVLFGDRTGDQLPDSVTVPTDEVAAQRLAALAERSGDLVSVHDVPPAPTAGRWRRATTPTPELSVRSFTRRLDHDWARTSYSSMTRAAHEHPPTSEPEVDTTTDERDTTADPTAPPSTSTPGDLPSPLTDLPGGAAFGTLVHDVLEDTDPDELLRRCTDAVLRHGVRGVDPAALAEALRPVLRTPLDEHGTTLGTVAAHDRLAELDFEMPLAGGDDTVTGARLADIVDLLRRHDLGPLAGYADQLARLPAQTLRGYLTGSIDAVLRLPGPRYAVVDYKTNRLGPEPLTTAHYRGPAMAAEMQHTHYALQALLYSVALHRFLRWRQRSYEPAVHLGPVLYLFVRGMAGPDTPAGAGVFTWTPDPTLVTELSDLLAGPR